MKTIAELFNSLADESRLFIIAQLQGGREQSVCDQLPALARDQSTAPRHLAYRKRHFWLEDRRGGAHYPLKKEMGEFLQAQQVPQVNKLAGSEMYRRGRERLETYLCNKNPAACG